VVYVDDNAIINAGTVPLANCLIFKGFGADDRLSAASGGQDGGHLVFCQKGHIWLFMMTSALTSLRKLLLIPDRDPLDYPFVESDVAMLQRVLADPARHAVDDPTWKDLMLSAYCAELSQEVSIFGQHVLYRRLREGGCETLAPSVAALADDPEQATALHLACKPLRKADKEIATLLYRDAPPAEPRWLGKAWMLAPMLLASIAAAMLVSPAAWLATFALLYFLMAQQVRYGHLIEEWDRSMRSLQMLLRVASQRGGPDAAAVARINRDLTRTPGGPLQGHQDWFALKNITHYFHSARVVFANLPLLRATLLDIGNLEADLALARHLARTPVYCPAVRSEGRAVALRDTVHPLLAAAQPLTLALDGRGAFISGQNGIGKSTLLRTVGLNLVAARAFGFCYARQAAVPDLPVYSSMQNDDSLLGGESLYVAELRRARQLLAAADGPHPGVYLIDEIFRGTNHLESVSSAAAVLDLLAERGLVLVSSHNLVLAGLLEHRIDALCVARDAAGMLRLSPGLLVHTNGIALLAEHGFGPRVESGAGKVFDWLNGYLAHPAASAGVLA